MNQLTLLSQSETVAFGDRAGVNMRSEKWAVSVALSGSLMVACSLLAPGAEAQVTSQNPRTAQATTAEPFAQPVRPPRRIRVYPRYLAEPDGVYPRYDPGPNAVRVCNASYVQEFRPSGTVIVPRMTCVWRRG